jgi:hypothetical protein
MEPGADAQDQYRLRCFLKPESFMKPRIYLLQKDLNDFVKCEIGPSESLTNSSRFPFGFFITFLSRD